MQLTEITGIKFELEAISRAEGPVVGSGVQVCLDSLARSSPGRAIGYAAAMEGVSDKTAARRGLLARVLSRVGNPLEWSLVDKGLLVCAATLGFVIDYALISDAGKPFEIEDRPTEWSTIVLKEAINITMEQIRGLQFKRLELTLAAKQKPKGLWFSIDSKEGESQAGDAAFASAIGTNLKKLSKEEIAVLTRHSAALLGHRVETYAQELKRAK